MKTAAAWLLALLLTVTLLPAQGEEIIVNRVAHPEIEFSFPDGAQLLEIYFPQIYGVDAAYVRYGEYSMLIDSAGIGNVSRGIQPQWPKFQALLEKLGVTEVTYALNTHPDGDHIGGFNHVLENISCKEFLLGYAEDDEGGDPVRFQVYSDLHAMGIPFHRVTDGEILPFGDVQATVYQRLDEEIVRTNGRSVTVMFQLGERRIFFTGDILGLTQRIFWEHRDTIDLHADIMKYPHHGYEPLYVPFQEIVNPLLCVITSGSSDAAGTAQLRDHKIKYVFTESGVLHLATDGQVWLVERIR